MPGELSTSIPLQKTRRKSTEFIPGRRWGGRGAKLQRQPPFSKKTAAHAPALTAYLIDRAEPTTERDPNETETIYYFHDTYFFFAN
jgi:hypothetical protein